MWALPPQYRTENADAILHSWFINAEEEFTADKWHGYDPWAQYGIKDTLHFLYRELQSFMQAHNYAEAIDLMVRVS